MGTKTVAQLDKEAREHRATVDAQLQQMVQLQMLNMQQAQPEPEKEPEVAEQPDVDLNSLMANAVSSLIDKDGKFDTKKFLKAIEESVGKKDFEKIEQGLLDYYAPQGVVEMTMSTWDLGYKGKAHAAASVAGYATLAVGGLELVGRWLDIPSIQLGTRVARWVLGD
jgi:hypothetical protein